MKTSFKDKCLSLMLPFFFLYFSPFAYGQSAQYFVLTEELDGAYSETTTDEVFHFRFTEEYQVPLDALLEYKLFDEENNLVSAPGMPAVRIKKGVNDIDLNLEPLHLCNLRFYRLEVKNAKGETFYAVFEINNGTGVNNCP